MVTSMNINQQICQTIGIPKGKIFSFTSQMKNPGTRKVRKLSPHLQYVSTVICPRKGQVISLLMANFTESLSLFYQ